MQSVDLEVLAQVERDLAAGRQTWLCSVVKTWGSSPRPIGSLLTCNAEGGVTGSLSGGCVEDDLLEKIQSGQLAADRPELHKYGLTPEDTERLGLPCGGHLYVVVEPLGAAHRHEFQHIVAALGERRCVRRELDLGSGASRVWDVDRFTEVEFDERAGRLAQTFGPRFQLFLIGAGMVSQYLAQMAQALDYDVTVCDPREHLTAQWQVEGTRVLTMMPDDAVREYAGDPYSAIIALTHDPRIDDMALMDALSTDAFYIGAMGSERTSAARRERLRQLDLSDAEIDRLHAPVGLPIGSKTPPEIAIAILAELTAVRKQVAVETVAAAARAAIAGA